MREYLKQHYTELVDRIEEQKAMSDEDKAALKAAVEEFKKNGAW